MWIYSYLPSLNLSTCLLFKEYFLVILKRQLSILSLKSLRCLKMNSKIIVLFQDCVLFPSWLRGQWLFRSSITLVIIIWAIHFNLHTSLVILQRLHCYLSRMTYTYHCQKVCQRPWFCWTCQPRLTPLIIQVY